MPEDRGHGSLGSWMRRRRKALDLTQAALAERVGCAEVTIRKWETEVARPARETAERLAACLELDPDEQAVFLQVARGERSHDHRSPSHTYDSQLRLAGAQVPIAPLPLDTIPLPASLPPGSRMPLRRNPLFVGRDADLRHLARVLIESETAAIGQVEIAAATGLGGIGKTQLACEFVHRYGQFFAGGVFWLSFADPAVVPAEIAACGGLEGMRLSADFSALPLNDQVQLVLAAWQSPLPRLLVFDNCEDEALLAQWQLRHGGCRMLVTSRRHHWDPALGVYPLALDVLSRNDSLILLRSFRPDLPADDADVAAIAEALGDLPLALHMAGRFLAKYRHVLTPAQYRARLHAPTILDDRSLRDAGLSPTQHVQHVARTFEQSYERLNPADPTDALARRLLAHAACFAPGELLPHWLLRETLELPEDDEEQSFLAEDALTRLTDLGLLETDAGGNFRMHRLLVAFVQAVLGTGVAQGAVEATMLRVVDALNEQQHPRRLLPVQPHLRFITEASRLRADAHTARLCHTLGLHLRLLGVYHEARSYLEQAVMIRERVLGVDHADTVNSLNHLSAVLWAQGQYRTAQTLMEQVVAIRQRVLGLDHADTASSLNNLGIVLDAQGQYAEARRYYEQALAIWERVLGPDHPDTAHSLNNIGGLLIAQGQYAEARYYYEQALAIRQRMLGPDHPHTAHSLNNLGEVFQAQGQYAEAQHYYEQALAIWGRVLGPDHPDTAYCLNNLGLMHQAQGQYAAAQGYYEQALAIREQALGSHHPDTARSLHALGEVLYAYGETARARWYLEQAATILEEQFGPAHSETQRTHQLLAALDGERSVTERGS